MARVELRISDNLNNELDKVTKNKSEFIREAVDEKLNKDNEKKLITLDDIYKITKEIEELKSHVVNLEKINFLQSKKIENNYKLILSMYETVASTKLLLIHLHGIEKAELILNTISQQTKDFVNNIKNELN
jgi:metal-responsive CopG/Arc/MetJ family transcriptional regulator